MITTDELGQAGAYEAITPTSAIGITSTLYNNANGQQAKGLLLTVEGGGINFTEDGTTPTNAAGTNVGHHLVSGANKEIRGIDNVRNFLCVDRVAASPATVKITIYY